MTEVTRFDSVLHWKDVGDGVPADRLIVPAGQTAPADAPRITPNFLWRDAQSRAVASGDSVSARSQDFITYVDTDNLGRPFSYLHFYPAGMANARPQSERAGLTPPDLSLSTVRSAQLAPLAIREGLAIPQAVIDAEDDLNAGAVYSASWTGTPTIRLSWTASSGTRFAKDLAVQSVASTTIGSGRNTEYYFAFILDIIPRNTPEGAVSQDRFDLLQLQGQATLEALPVYWQDLQPGQMLEGAFTPRKLFARRDDSQVENIEYGQTLDGATSISVQRVTAFACRQTQAPPLNTILSEYNLWDGSERTWQVQSVELLDRGRHARLQCTEYTGS